VADVKPLQALKEGGAGKAVVAFAPESLRHSDRWGQKQYAWSNTNEPKASLLYYVGKPTQSVRVEIRDEKDVLVRTLEAKGAAGFHTCVWDLKVTTPTTPAKKRPEPAATEPALKYAGKGKYKIKLLNGTESSEAVLEIK
jgi:hypothetical protein